MDVNLLRSTVRVRLDEQADTALKTFRADELEVLGGKAKRAEFLAARAEEAARAAGIEIVHVPTMKMLGQRCGIAVGCACAAEIAAPEKSVRS